MTVKSTSCLKPLPEDNYNYLNKKIQQNGDSAPTMPSLPKSSIPVKIVDVPVSHQKSEKNNAVTIFTKLSGYNMCKVLHQIL